jgi:hypothetical protein
MRSRREDDSLSEALNIEQREPTAV